jgi:ferredoxin-NADP reductase
LFYSNREADDAAFMDELQTMAAQNPNFTLVLTVTGHKTLAWPYEKGHIAREMLTRYLLGLNGPVYYIAGPSGMVTGMTDLLVPSGVSPDDMRIEEFGDYKLYRDSTPADQMIDNNRSNSAP